MPSYNQIQNVSRNRKTRQKVKKFLTAETIEGLSDVEEKLDSSDYRSATNACCSLMDSASGIAHEMSDMMNMGNNTSDSIQWGPKLLKSKLRKLNNEGPKGKSKSSSEDP